MKWHNQNTTDSSLDCSQYSVSRTEANITSQYGEGRGWGTQLKSNPPKGGGFVFDDPTAPCQPQPKPKGGGILVVPAPQRPTYSWKYQAYAIRCGPFADKQDAERVALDTWARHGTPVRVQQGANMEWWVTFEFRFPVLTP